MSHHDVHWSWRNINEKIHGHVPLRRSLIPLGKPSMVMPHSNVHQSSSHFVTNMNSFSIKQRAIKFTSYCDNHQWFTMVDHSLTWPWPWLTKISHYWPWLSIVSHGLHTLNMRWPWLVEYVWIWVWELLIMVDHI